MVGRNHIPFLSLNCCISSSFFSIYKSASTTQCSKPTTLNHVSELLIIHHPTPIHIHLLYHLFQSSIRLSFSPNDWKTDLNSLAVNLPISILIKHIESLPHLSPPLSSGTKLRIHQCQHTHLYSHRFCRSFGRVLCRS